MNEHTTIWLLAILGWLIFVLIQLQSGMDASKRKKEKFSFKFWFNDNGIHLAISLLGMIALVFMRPTIQHFITQIKGLEGFNDLVGSAYLLSFMFGLSSSFIVKVLYKKARDVGKNGKEK